MGSLDGRWEYTSIAEELYFGGGFDGGGSRDIHILECLSSSSRRVNLSLSRTAARVSELIVGQAVGRNTL